MKKSSLALLGLLLVLIVGLTAFFLTHQPQPSDTDQIRAQIDSATTAAGNRDAGGVVSILSSDYKDSMNTKQRLYAILLRAFHDAGPVVISSSPPGIQLQGETATSTSHLTLRGRDSGEVYYDKTVTLTWKREEGKRFFVIPVKVWRVVGAEYGASLTDGE